MNNHLIAPPTEAPRLRVLIADDTVSNRSMIEVFLRKLGYDSIAAADGREAVDVFEREQPDLVLMDVMMPVMDGFEATRKIRSLLGNRWVPVVMLSAMSYDTDIAAGLDAGADDYLVKPISFAVFSAKMRTLTRQMAMQRSVTESLEQIRAISEAVIDGLVTIDERGIIQSCNRAACQAFGYLPAELIGSNVSKLMPEPHRSEHDAYLARYLTGHGAQVIDKLRNVTGQRKNGELFPVELGVTDIKLPDRHLFVGVVRDITERERIARERAETRASLERLYSEQEHEQELAREIMERQIHGDWLNDPRVQYSITPTTRFSGDIVMMARSPDGRTFALLADATGHGLAAAISVQPVLSTFYNEVARDIAVDALVSGINDLLRSALPVGRFVGAAILCLSADARSAEIWVGGVPQALLIEPDGRVARRFDSIQLPLGIVDSSGDSASSVRFDVEPGQQLMLYSDGLVEAADAGGKAFGEDGLERALAGSLPEERAAAVRQALSAHLGGASQHDDVSMLILTCVP